MDELSSQSFLNLYNFLSKFSGFQGSYC